MTDYPNRLRLRGGRNTHVARPTRGIPERLLTPCGYMEGERDERKPDNAPVTCRECARIIAWDAKR